MGRQSSTHDEGTSTPQEHRSLNTSRSYASKQEEFKSWCNDRFPENTKHIVTGEKLHSFLSEAVMNRQSRRGRKAVDMDRKVKSSTMELYVAAITDLFQKQVRLGINSHPHPRIPAVKQLLRNMRREDMLKRIESNSKGATGGGAGSAAAQKSPSPMTHQRSSELAHSQRKQRAAQENNDSSNVPLQKSVPALQEEIQTLKKTLSLTLEKMDTLLSQFTAITSGAATLNFQMSWPNITQPPSNPHIMTLPFVPVPSMAGTSLQGQPSTDPLPPHSTRAVPKTTPRSVPRVIPQGNKEAMHQLSLSESEFDSELELELGSESELENSHQHDIFQTAYFNVGGR